MHSMKKSALILLAVLFISPFDSFSQRLKNRWKGMRGEISLGLGASNFLGELGGADQIGTHFFKDYEWSETHPAIQFGYRYKLTRAFALNTHLTYGVVSGDDKTTKEFFRSYRNLSFKSTIFEWNLNGEFAFIKDQVGHRYRLRGVRGQRGYEMMSYVFAGVGLFHFNPKANRSAEGGDEVWVNLHPLHTEGQTLLETRKKYHRLQFCIPVGIGFKYTISRRWGIGLEYGIRKTFTDYIDDASRTYVSPSILSAQTGLVDLSDGNQVSVGVLAAELADRSNQLYPQITSPGAQRGDPRYTDSYMFGVVTINYKLKTGRTVYPLF
jgi:hypothetical protein